MPDAMPPVWPAYALGLVLGGVLGLLAAESAFLVTGSLTDRGWDDAAAWQYIVAGLSFLAVAMGVMVWIGRRVRAMQQRR